MIRQRPRILYVDAYDSFSHNVVGLLENAIDALVRIVRIDDSSMAANLKPFLRNFDAVVVGPGPGDPANANDVGFLNQLWTLDEEDVLPILGICLGFQSMALAYGGEVRQLKKPRHGTVREIRNDRCGLFEGIDTLAATQYHSLHVVLPNAPTADQVEPLAWDDGDSENGKVLMALRIPKRPFSGVQFHPESICTSVGGERLVKNWWRMAQQWRTQHCKERPPSQDPLISAQPTPSSASPEAGLSSFVRTKCPNLFPKQLPEVYRSEQPLHGLSVTQICESLNLKQQELALLESQGHTSGRFSIVGLITPDETPKISFSLHNMIVSISTESQTWRVKVSSSEEVWQLLETIMDANWTRTCGDSNSTSIPFSGGLMGYVSYEAGLDLLGNEACTIADRSAEDISFAFVQKSILLDHGEGRIIVQHLGAPDRRWLHQMTQTLEDLNGQSKDFCDTTPSVEKALDAALASAYVEKPDETTYCDQVASCQDSLACGDSYELCLTDETTISTPRTKTTYVDSWTLYKRLRENNAAPFGAFLSLQGVDILSSSPERFLQWTPEGKFQYRPIKGTVAKHPGVDLAAATEMLNCSKERAENLMIVDLIRHDLSGMIGAKNCSVPKLMQVEEYQTVFQLVSVVEGQIPKAIDRKPSTSVSVLKASLPPGSMTGAPKKRSCQILSKLEKRPRGVYSGVIGYMDVGGGGDFSVVIRTAVKCKDETTQKMPKGSTDQGLVPHDIWRIGAGGAITVQSKAIDEFREMESKLNSVLKTFQPRNDDTQALKVVADPFFRLRTSLRAVDGCIEEMPFFYHHARLLASARAFNMRDAVTSLSHPGSCQRLQRQIEQYLGKQTGTPAPQKVDVAISAAGDADINSAIISPPVYPFDSFAGPMESQPLITEVYLSPYFTEASLFTTHKTSHRPEYQKAREAVTISALPPTRAEVLLYNRHDEITEASFCTVYFQRNGQWVTPPSSTGCNVGTTRALALENRWCVEWTVHRKDIRHQEPIILSNGARGFWWGRIHLPPS